MDVIFDFPPDNKRTFSASCFHEKPLVDVENTEESMKSMNLHRVKKGD